ncbi:MAG: PH domain-containing protein [Lachnospiraceae bacterium]|nr:PH domain-containing protein [Lachnospiraceae bacterium]MDE6254381.1 PH domain-containing protein [Lachnospiraceae bacterium]
MDYVWKDRKRTLFGLPWSFTVYSLTNEKLLITTGFFNKHEEEVRLYRIMDISLNRTFGQRIFGLGTIHVNSADKSTPEFDIKSVKDSEKIKDMLSDMVEEERMRKRVSGREFMSDYSDSVDDD